MESDWEYKHTFTALYEDGREYTLHEYREVIDIANKNDPNAKLEGRWDYRTDGLSVDNLGNGKYKIVETGKILTSDYHGTH